MKTLFYFGLALAACRLYAQPINPAWRHLPPDAAAIYHLNLAALTAKVPWYALAAPIPAPQRNTSNRELVAILRRLDIAGVDVRQELYIIESGDASGKSTSILLRLEDTARWSAFLRLQEPGIRLISGQRDTCYGGREKLGVAWNHEFAVITFVRSIPHAAQPGELRHLAMHRSLTLLQGYDDSTCIREPMFQKGFADDADLHAWTRHGELLYAVLGQLMPFGSNRSKSAGNDPGQLTLSGSRPVNGPCLHTLSSVRFEKGRILLTSLICLPPGTDSLYARLIAHPLSTNLSAHLPTSGMLGMCCLHFNPSVIGDLLTQLQTRGATESLLFDKGLSLESFVHGFQGDFALVASHTNRQQAPLSLSFAAATLDQPAVAQWTNRFHPSSCRIKDSLLFIGAAGTDTTTSRSPGLVAGTPDSALLSRLRDPSIPLSGYIDCKALAGYWKGLPLLSAFNRLSFTAGRLNSAKQIENTFELTLADPRAYSLQTLWPLLGP